MPKMFIGTDDLPFALTSPATTGGTSTAYTLTDSRIGTPADGQVFAFILHTGCGVAPTLAVNGGSAVALMRNTATGGNTGFVSPQLLADQVVIVRYESSGPAYRVISHFGLQASDIPSTLNATTFAGAVTLSTGSILTPSIGIIANSVDGAGSLSLCGGTTNAQSNGAFCKLHGNYHATKPGIAEYYTGNASGAKHQFFDKNAAEQLRVDENGVTFSNLAISANIFYRVNNLGFTAVYGGTDYTSAVIRLSGSGETYPGAHQSFAPLITRTASTAIALCPVATGDMAYVTILESSIASCKVKVDTAGTVTFTDLDGNAASASIVNSSSPAAAEYGVYISAGVLYFKGGSSYAGKMASFPQIGKA